MQTPIMRGVQHHVNCRRGVQTIRPLQPALRRHWPSACQGPTLASRPVAASSCSPSCWPMVPKGQRQQPWQPSAPPACPPPRPAASWCWPQTPCTTWGPCWMPQTCAPAPPSSPSSAPCPGKALRPRVPSLPSLACTGESVAELALRVVHCSQPAQACCPPVR